MFRQMLYTQWKWSRLLIVAGALAGFSIPLLSVRPLGDPTVAGAAIGMVLTTVGAYGLLYPLLAGTAGLMLALATWGPDHAGRHVYALTLPLPRWHYALLRFGAGAVLLGGIVSGVLLGTLVAVASVELPAGLRAYPFALTLRFALAAFVAYGAFFAVTAGTNRTAGFILAAIAGLILAQVMVSAAGSDVDFLVYVVARLFLWPGPLEIFTGRWMLIDV
jgi:hypothetical protein